MTLYQQKQKRKSIYIPLCVAGKVTNLVCAQKIGITIRSVTELKRRYKLYGKQIFVRASVSHRPYNKKYSDDFIQNILHIYYENWNGAPYATFWRGLRDIEKINIPYETLRYIMIHHNIKSAHSHKAKKELKHESRKERPRTGELIQMDASKHDWFMNGTYTTAHGAIDDSTHKLTGLYFCDNECRLGYNEVLRQTFTNYGVMEAVYIDRHSSFVTTPQHKSLEERLEREKISETHFIDLCKQLNIEIILALSAEAKGRIERVWQTLQGILPFYFRRLGITNNQAANNFVQKWLPVFNKDFSIPPALQQPAFRKLPAKCDTDYLLSIKISKRTDQWGTFLFHNHYFEVVAPQKACIRFTLCLSEVFGLKAYIAGKYYNIKLVDNYIADVRGGDMPKVEQDLISRYLLSDIHSDTA